MNDQARFAPVGTFSPMIRCWQSGEMSETALDSVP